MAFAKRRIMNVQFCSGGNQLVGFTNHDMDVDITKPLPYKDGEVDFVFCEHGAEHISGPQVLGFFEEVYRILKPGGVFRLCIPVLDRLSRPAAKDIIQNHGHLTIWNTDLVPIVLWVAGFGSGLIVPVDFNPDIDGHWRVIGEEKDKAETARFEAMK